MRVCPLQWHMGQNALKAHAIATGIGIALAVVGAAYMVYLRVPSIIATHPELAEISFRTALFSDNTSVYMYYHYPSVMLVLNAALFVFILNIWALKH